MKIFICPVLLLLLAGCAPRSYTRIKPGPNALTDYFDPLKNPTPRISAHRGGGDLPGYPENCIESFGYLARQMPVTIECDIDLTKDSVLVMLHDATLDRTTTGSGKLIDRTYAETQQFRLEDNAGTPTPFKIPTLDEVLRWGRGKVTFTLDVKRNVSFESVVRAIRRADAAGYAAVITYNATDAAKLHRLDPSVLISVTIRSFTDYARLHDLGIPDNRMVAFVGVAEPDPSVYAFLRKRGIGCILGTLGNLDKQAAAKGDSTYRRFVRNGATMLSTDRPLEAWRALRAKKLFRLSLRRLGTVG
jgi:glycerophosphoryl diester phosphodiesterase